MGNVIHLNAATTAARENKTMNREQRTERLGQIAVDITDADKRARNIGYNGDDNVYDNGDNPIIMLADAVNDLLEVVRAMHEG